MNQLWTWNDETTKPGMDKVNFFVLEHKREQEQLKFIQISTLIKMKQKPFSIKSWKSCLWSHTPPLTLVHLHPPLEFLNSDTFAITWPSNFLILIFQNNNKRKRKVITIQEKEIRSPLHYLLPLTPRSCYVKRSLLLTFYRVEKFKRWV